MRYVSYSICWSQKLSKKEENVGECGKKQSNWFRYHPEVPKTISERLVTKPNRLKSPSLGWGFLLHLVLEETLRSAFGLIKGRADVLWARKLSSPSHQALQPPPPCAPTWRAQLCTDKGCTQEIHRSSTPSGSGCCLTTWCMYRFVTPMWLSYRDPLLSSTMWWPKEQLSLLLSPPPSSWEASSWLVLHCLTGRMAAKAAILSYTDLHAVQHQLFHYGGSSNPNTAETLQGSSGLRNFIETSLKLHCKKQSCNEFRHGFWSKHSQDWGSKRMKRRKMQSSRYLVCFRPSQIDALPPLKEQFLVKQTLLCSLCTSKSAPFPSRNPWNFLTIF